MDDTCILATSRDECVKKLKILNDFCKEKDIVINEAKTQFMVINGNGEDKQPLFVDSSHGNLYIEHTNDYVYLGAHFSCDGKISSCISTQVEKKAKQVVKLIIFLSINRDAPFLVKKKVFHAAFLTSILYSCESWFETPVDKLQIMFNSALKSLLGVRKTTPNILCLIECGYPPLKFYVKEQQRRYFCKIFVRSHNVDLDDPLIFALHLHTSARTGISRFVSGIENSSSNFLMLV
jgi:hypothetical protein